MARWALGLAIVPCFGLTSLTGIGLAIAVLVRSRHGVDHGKRLAIGALVLGSAWLVLGFALGVLGVVQDLTGEVDRDDRGQVVSRSDVLWTKLRAGDCFDQPGSFTDRGATPTTTVTAVPCGQPHQFQAYATFDLEDGDYPGDDEVDLLARQRCMPSFREFVGVGYRRSELQAYTLAPRNRTWRFLHNRRVVCLAGRPGRLATGTFEHTRR